jgi:hypothetical protein
VLRHRSRIANTDAPTDRPKDMFCPDYADDHKPVSPAFRSHVSLCFSPLAEQLQQRIQQISQKTQHHSTPHLIPSPPYDLIARMPNTIPQTLYTRRSTNEREYSHRSSPHAPALARTPLDTASPLPSSPLADPQAFER